MKRLVITSILIASPLLWLLNNQVSATSIQTISNINCQNITVLQQNYNLVLYIRKLPNHKINGGE
ncbi:MAG: hypothetical protein WBA41_18620 [Rivularia sp. (in: cyanobacteria)]